MSSRPITIVIVTHQGSTGVVGRCLESVRAAGGFDHLVVVDNSPAGVRSHGIESGIGAVGALDSAPDRTLDVDLWLRVENEGYGAAANRGIAAAAQHWPDDHLVAILNDDTRVAAQWLAPLVAALDNDSCVGAVQPKLLVADSDPQRVNSVGVVLDDTGAGTDEGFQELDRPRWAESRCIEIFTAGAVVFRPEFLAATGGFDERYFLYYEDVDLALRGAELGWRYRCEPSSTVEHWPGSSSSGLGADLRRVQDRNRLWVAFRFGSPGRITAALWLSIRRLRHEPRRAHARALLSGVAGAPRRLVERRRAAATALSVESISR